LETLATQADLFAVCREELLISPRHQEALFYVFAYLSRFVTRSIAIPDPLSDDVLLHSRQLLCLSVFHAPVDLQVYAEWLASESFVLRLTAAYCITLDFERCHALLVLAVDSIMPLIALCESSVFCEVFTLLDTIGTELSRVIPDFVPQLVSEILKKWCSLAYNSAVAVKLAVMIGPYLRIPLCFPALIEMVIPVVLNGLRDAHAADAACNLLATCVCHLPDSQFPLDNGIIAEIGCAFLESAAMRSDGEAQFDAIRVAAFLARSGLVRPFDQWFQQILMKETFPNPMCDLAIALFTQVNPIQSYW
jgi:hypothetical protein